MEFFDFLKLLKRKKGTIFTLVFVVIILSLGLSLINPLKYSAKSRLLVVQNSNGVDPYTVSKSNEYLGNLFSQIAYSGSFYNMVLESPYDIDKNYFSGDYNKQIKTWGKTISTKTLSDTGIIEVNIYHPNPYQAQQIALAVNDILINKNSNYQGSGQSIKVNIIDQPLVSNYPVKPNLPQNLVIALMASLLFSLFYIYIFPEERYNIQLWSSKKREKKIKINNHSIKIDYQSLGQEMIKQDILQSVKRFTANQINKIEGRTGTLWHNESYDTTIRNEIHLHNAINYTLNNPVAAGLVKEWWEWKGTKLF